MSNGWRLLVGLVLTTRSVLGDGYSTSVTADDPRLQNLTPPYEHQIRAQAKELFLEDEVSKRLRQKMVSTNEKDERERKETEVANRKRKHEDAKKWEGELRACVPVASLREGHGSPFLPDQHCGVLTPTSLPAFLPPSYRRSYPSPCEKEQQLTVYLPPTIDSPHRLL